MPAPTERSRKFMGAVRSYMEGRAPSASKEIRRAARGMTHQQVRDMTRKPRKPRRT